MKRFLAIITLAIAMMGFGSVGAQAGHYGHGCYDSYCYESCAPRKHCYNTYSYKRVRVHCGYRRDCYGCKRPVYRYVTRKVYTGRHCSWY